MKEGRKQRKGEAINERNEFKRDLTCSAASSSLYVHEVET